MYTVHIHVTNQETVNNAYSEITDSRGASLSNKDCSFRGGLSRVHLVFSPILIVNL